MPIDFKSIYPKCIAGNNIAPSENYNNLIDFLVKQPTKFIDGMDRLIEELRKTKKKRGVSVEAIRDKIIEINSWINQHKFNRKNLNDKLKQYAKGQFSLEDLIEEDDDNYYDDEEEVLCE